MFLRKTQKGVASCKAEFFYEKENRMDKRTRLRIKGEVKHCPIERTLWLYLSVRN